MYGSGPQWPGMSTGPRCPEDAHAWPRCFDVVLSNVRDPRSKKRPLPDIGTISKTNPFLDAIHHRPYPFRHVKVQTRGQGSAWATESLVETGRISKLYFLSAALRRVAARRGTFSGATFVAIARSVQGHRSPDTFCDPFVTETLPCPARCDPPTSVDHELSFGQLHLNRWPAPEGRQRCTSRVTVDAWLREAERAMIAF